MPIPIPHKFPSLVEGPVQLVIIAGTGLSAPNAPTVIVLKGKLDGVAKKLGVDPDSDFWPLPVFPA